MVSQLNGNPQATDEDYTHTHHHLSQATSPAPISPHAIFLSVVLEGWPGLDPLPLSPSSYRKKAEYSRAWSLLIEGAARIWAAWD